MPGFGGTSKYRFLATNMKIETDDYIEIINDKDPTRRIRINKKITFTREELGLSPRDLCRKLVA